MLVTTCVYYYLNTTTCVLLLEHHQPTPPPAPPTDEYIKDTEEFIDIDLDWNRNRLIKLDIVLTTATFAIAPFNVFAGMKGCTHKCHKGAPARTQTIQGQKYIYALVVFAITRILHATRTAQACWVRMWSSPGLSHVTTTARYRFTLSMHLCLCAA